jgi:uncharacterized damage-inducible protein DinB
VYTRAELLAYLEHGRARCRTLLAALDEEGAGRERGLGRSTRGTLLELVLYNLRHVQHHAGQLHLLLRQRIDDAPGWVAVTARQLDGEER